MNIEQAKQLDIVEYLAWKGYNPCKIHGKEVFYNSPFRSESSPSFSVDPHKNVWSDKGLPGERGQKFLGGAIHQLAAKLCGSMSAGLADLANFSGHRSPTTNPLTTPPKQSGSIRIINSKIIDYDVLESYLKSRAVSLKIARIVAREVWYYNGDNPKKFFAIGLQNVSGGWELRSSVFKGGNEPKDVFWLRKNHKTCRVFEGMFDMLSFMSFGSEKKKSDWLCLNSVSFAARAIPMLANYEVVELYLDNDDGGNRATQFILQNLPKAIDRRNLFYGYKDVNAHLVHLNHQQ